MFLLCLNDMRACHVEDLQVVAKSATKEALVALVERERVESYGDEGENSHHGSGYQYSKCFRKGGPLEWFNAPWDHAAPRHFRDIGTRDEYVANAALEAGRKWDRESAEWPDAEGL